MKKRSILISATALVLCGFFKISALADSKIYWTGASMNDAFGKIWRSNIDGSSMEDLVLSGDAWFVTLDVSGGKMYWTDQGSRGIKFANLDGSGVTDLVTTPPLFPADIALDTGDGKMYLTNGGHNKIQRANLDGSEVTDLITTGLSGPSGIALDVAGGKMYWTDSYSIKRANLDGSEMETVVTGLSFAFDIALDISNGKMYWTDIGLTKIQCANLDGSEVTDLTTNALYDPWGIALDISSGKMYWANFGLGKIQRANLDGSDVEDVISGFWYTAGIALDLTKPVLKVAVDIKPLSCPNPLNVKSTGVLPVAVLGSEDFDVNSIDAASIRLAGIAPIRSSYEDAATPVSDSNECNCNTDEPDGFTDLILKFETQSIMEAIGEVNNGDELTLELSGVLADDTPIEGSDCIIIRGKHKPFNKADFNGDRIVDMADFAAFAENWLQSTVLEH